MATDISDCPTDATMRISTIVDLDIGAALDDEQHDLEPSRLAERTKRVSHSGQILLRNHHSCILL